jgi:hypothetical protein
VKLYAELPGARARQILSDVAAVAFVAVVILVAKGVYRLVSRLAAPGEAIEDAGRTVAGSLGRAAQAVGQTPFVGRALGSPLASAAGAGRTLADAGRAQQDVVLTLALWLGLVIATAGVLMVLLVYLPRRALWIREASAASHLRDTSADLRVLAYRAVATRRLSLLRRAVPDPGAALAAGEFDTLARLELKALGLRPRS